MKKLIAAFGLVALAACGGDEKAGEGEATNVDSSTAVISGQDTVQTPTVVETQDTVVKTTTTTVDTVHGQAQNQGQAAGTDTAKQH